MCTSVKYFLTGFHNYYNLNGIVKWWTKWRWSSFSGLTIFEFINRYKIVQIVYKMFTFTSKAFNFLQKNRRSMKLLKLNVLHARALYTKQPEVKAIFHFDCSGHWCRMARWHMQWLKILVFKLQYQMQWVFYLKVTTC